MAGVGVGVGRGGTGWIVVVVEIVVVEGSDSGRGSGGGRGRGSGSVRGGDSGVGSVEAVVVADVSSVATGVSTASMSSAQTRFSLIVAAWMSS